MEFFFDAALREAEIAASEGNVPVGCVIVCDDVIVASSHNTKNSSGIAINHAELLCIAEACKVLNSWYLNDCVMYVTLKPCDMCLFAIAEARIKKVFFLVDSFYGHNLNKNKDNIEIVDVKYKNSFYANMLSLFFRDKRK